jgi:predicted lipid-binding transport protein (Tim44 family)
MVRLRVLLACLLMAALPLQGMAAVSMMLCSGSAAKTMAVSVPMANASHGHDAAAQAAHAPALHDHASHDHGAMAADTDTHHPTHAHGESTGTDTSAGASHECGICGAGCHSVAITSDTVAVHASALPQAPIATPIPPVHTRTTPVPDRPPRA